MDNIYQKSLPQCGMAKPKLSYSENNITKSDTRKNYHDIVASGEIDEHCRWTLFRTGMLFINGKGNMKDWKSFVGHDPTAPWYNYRHQIKKVQISDQITSIGDWAFFDCYNLSAVEIPSSVRWIGRSAFNSCSKLTQIHLPNVLRTIGEAAFYNCTKLTRIEIPKSTFQIDADAFRGCTGLQSVTMPAKFDRSFFKTYYGIPKNIVQFI